MTHNQSRKQPLQNCPSGSIVYIVSVEGEAQYVRRLNDMGLLPGAQITVQRRAPFGGPMEILINTMSLGIRLDRRTRIIVEYR